MMRRKVLSFVFPVMGFSFEYYIVRHKAVPLKCQTKSTYTFQVHPIRTYTFINFITKVLSMIM